MPLAVRYHEYGPPGVLTLEQVPKPEPGPGQVLVRVHAAGVNPIDWKFRAGYLQQYVPVELPSTPGLDVSGVVDAVGEGVTEFAPGDAVFGRGAGTYAEYAVAPVGTLALKPAGLSFDAAATLSVGGVTAWTGLFDIAELEPSQRLLVQGGAGGVGALVVQLGRWKGAHVIATASTGNIELVRSLGADEVVDYSEVKFEDVVSDIDVVYDTVGGEVTDRSWGVLKPGGWLITIGGMVDAEKAAAHGVRASGAQGPEVSRPILEQLAHLIASGDLRPQIGTVFPLAEAVAAQAASETGHGHGRIVLHIAD
jgi:NADPH:quinone reductase-like Zn-dependent oxidoreductase